MGKKRESKYLRVQVEAKKEILKTILLFLIICLMLNFAYFFFFKEQIPQRSFTASLVAFLLNLFRLPAKANGTFVLMNGFSIDIIGECTGIFSIIVYCSVIFAYPTDIKKKAIGMIGIPILYGINLIRLISTVLVGLFIPSLLDFFHDYLWQVFLIVFVVLLFLIWRDRVAEVKEK
ncbi:archaeosortase/exosortase family protein [Halobacteriota archaeon]